VNGLRACHRRGFGRWLSRSGAGIVGVQEVRARPEDLPASLASPQRWHAHFSPAERAGYSGVGLFSRLLPDAVETSLGVSRFDREGRVQLVRFGRLVVANVYFPNGNGVNRDHSRVPFKLAFYRTLWERLQTLRRSGARVIVMGDFNTAHDDVDLARPRENQGTSGFLPRERRELSRWLATGFTDTFRAFEPRGGHYTWWSQRQGVRARNVGWRIDYVLASRAASPFIRRAFHQPRIQGSDHCPIGVDVDPEIFGTGTRARAEIAAARESGQSEARNSA
jgi:exodeoxyribonuclease-3